MGEFKPMVKMMTTEPTVALSLRAGERWALSVPLKKNKGVERK